jgi:hypothetical protein
VIRRVAAIALVHVLLAAVAVGAIALWGPGDNPARVRITVPDADPRAPDNPETVALVEWDGFHVRDSTALQHGSSPAVLGEVEADTLTKAGVVRVAARVTRDGGLTRGVWQLSVHDGADPHDALRAIDDLYGKGGWTRRPTEARGLLVRAQTPDGRQPLYGYRAHYVRAPYLIRIETYGTDKALVDREFAALATRQLAEWPPR